MPLYVAHLNGEDLPLTTDESAFVESFFDTWNNDIDAYLELLAADATIETTRGAKYDILVEGATDVPRDKFEAMSRWEAAIGTESTVDSASCANRAGRIECLFSTVDILIAGTFDTVRGAVEIEVVDGAIQSLGFSWLNPGMFNVVDEFGQWLKDNHPDVGPTGRYLELFTAESSTMWVEYVPLYLEALGTG